MVTQSEENHLSAQVAGIAATLVAHGERTGKVESGVEKLDAKFDGLANDIRDRFDRVYPDLAVLRTQVIAQEKSIEDLRADNEEMHKTLRTILGTAIVLIIGIIGDAIWAGFIKF